MDSVQLVDGTCRCEDSKREIYEDEILHYPMGEWCPLERPAMQLVILLERTPAVWTVAVSGIAGMVCDLPENFEKWKKKEATRLHDRVERSAASLTAYCPFARLRE